MRRASCCSAFCKIDAPVAPEEPPNIPQPFQPNIRSEVGTRDGIVFAPPCLQYFPDTSRGVCALSARDQLIDRTAQFAQLIRSIAVSGRAAPWCLVARNIANRPSKSIGVRCATASFRRSLHSQHSLRVPGAAAGISGMMHVAQAEPANRFLAQCWIARVRRLLHLRLANLLCLAGRGACDAAILPSP